MPVVAIIGAIALVSALAIKAIGAYETQQEFRAKNGWSLDEMFTSLVGKYDRDGDGRLAWNAVMGVRMLGESTLKYTDRRTEPIYGYRIPTGTVAIKETTSMYSIEPLLRRADVDGDGIATRAEIMAVLRAYDPDGDGRVDAAQRKLMIDEIGSVLVSRDTRTVGIIPPQQSSSTNHAGNNSNWSSSPSR